MNKTSGDFHEQYLKMVADRDAWLRRAGEYETKYDHAAAVIDGLLAALNRISEGSDMGSWFHGQAAEAIERAGKGSK